ncbi:hypothetical protein DR950_18800 [Kitasatospora xanthocidica]|uniref:Tn3 transposase DDE domain-containing protein n=1 Tax=Kitasatospora xanthocidica TaxID=83382 RepID=A0A372ZUI7_9ACTN|nr:hypothetical protein DR950_18800 [Kitasatospora xanthocidica]
MSVSEAMVSRTSAMTDWTAFDVRDEDVARLSPFVRSHINRLGRCSFRLPVRPLRGPDVAGA